MSNITVDKNKIFQFSKRVFFVFFGVLITQIGFYFFFLPSNIVTGGMGGLYQILEGLISKYLPWKFYNLLTQAICLLLALFFLGFDFFIKTLLAVSFDMLIPFVLTKIDSNLFYNMLENKLLLCFLFGTVLQAIGVSICLKQNACTGGMDIIQKLISKYLKVPFSIAMYFTDISIIILSGSNLFSTKSMSLGKRFLYDLSKVELVSFGLFSIFLMSYLIDNILANSLFKRNCNIVTNNSSYVSNVILSTFNKNSLVTKCIDNNNNSYELVSVVLSTKQAFKLEQILNSSNNDFYIYFTKAKEEFGCLKNKNS